MLEDSSEYTYTAYPEGDGKRYPSVLMGCTGCLKELLINGTKKVQNTLPQFTIDDHNLRIEVEVRPNHSPIPIGAVQITAEMILLAMNTAGDGRKKLWSYFRCPNTGALFKLGMKINGPLFKIINSLKGSTLTTDKYKNEFWDDVLEEALPTLVRLAGTGEECPMI